VAIFSKRAEKETFVEDRDRTQERIKKEGIFAYGCTERRYVGRNAEGGAAGGLPFYLTAQNPNLPHSIVSLRDLQVILQPTFHTPERDAGNEPLMK
jgi:hypothetical protein